MQQVVVKYYEREEYSIGTLIPSMIVCTQFILTHRLGTNRKCTIVGLASFQARPLKLRSGGQNHTHTLKIPYTQKSTRSSLYVSFCCCIELLCIIIWNPTVTYLNVWMCGKYLAQVNAGLCQIHKILVIVLWWPKQWRAVGETWGAAEFGSLLNDGSHWWFINK